MERIDVCKHRSPERVKGKVKVCSCGVTKDVTEYSCIKRDIFPLTNQICDQCGVFEEK